jgi:hypothetical protein
MDGQPKEGTVKYYLVPGEIRANAPELVVDHDDVKVFEVDLDSKYPGFVSYGGWGTGNRLSVAIHADGRTLELDDSRRGKVTQLVFELEDGEWVAVSDAARYTWHVVVFRSRG